MAVSLIQDVALHTATRTSREIVRTSCAGRAGWYSYDLIDNGGHASAEVLLPEYQRVKAGDVFPALPDALDAFVVAEATEPRSLVLTVPGLDKSTIVSWVFFLEAADGDRTRINGQKSAHRRGAQQQTATMFLGVSGIS